MLGEIIRENRKKMGLTQEEMANRLGVTAPAVNKWENNNSTPDIHLLAPIARLLNVTLDHLLSFHEELGDEEIDCLVKELDKKFEKEEYDQVFRFAESKITEYPNCNRLIWQLTVVLDARRMFETVQKAEQYDERILSWYKRVLQDSDDELVKHAADSLYGYYMRNEDYDEAEKYLSYFPKEDPLSKNKRADICVKKGQTYEAYKLKEEILFSQYQVISQVMHSLYMMSLEKEKGDVDNQENGCQAHRKSKNVVIEEIKYSDMYLEKEVSLAKLFDMGEYHEVSPMLDKAAGDKNVNLTLNVVKRMLDNVGTVLDFKKSWLYRHMQFSDVEPAFCKGLEIKLLELFQDEETFGYMKGNDEWERLIENVKG